MRNKEALPCVRRYSWWVQAVSGSNIFFAKYRGSFDGSQMSGGGIIILRIIRRHFLACDRGPNCQPLHVQSTLDACRSLTMLTRPRREHQGGGRWRGLVYYQLRVCIGSGHQSLPCLRRWRWWWRIRIRIVRVGGAILERLTSISTLIDKY